VLGKVIAVIRSILNGSVYQGLNFNLTELRVGYIKKVGITLFCLVMLLCLMMFTSCFVGLVNAQTGSTITIMSDGGVGQTDLIQRNGDVYTLTGDIFGTISVKKDGITIDGAGYAIKGMGNGIDLRKDSTAIPPAYGNVVVKNARFCDKGHIFTSSCGNSFINNTFEGGGIWIVGNNDGDIGNVIKHNVFINASWGVFVDYTGRANNVVTANNFINSGIQYGLYSGLDVDRNYWSDYSALYPDAKEVGRTGVWDVPYGYVRLHGDGDPIMFDYHPLVYPIKGAGAPEVDDNTEPVPTASMDEHNLESFPTTLIIATVVVSVIIVSTILLMYFKKRK